MPDWMWGSLLGLSVSKILLLRDFSKFHKTGIYTDFSDYGGKLGFSASCVGIGTLLGFFAGL